MEIDALDARYPWWLLKSSQSHLELHRESPDGYDLALAKGNKSKSWHESKLFFGKPAVDGGSLLLTCAQVLWVPILDVVESLESTCTRTQKRKGKQPQKRKCGMHPYV